MDPHSLTRRDALKAGLTAAIGTGGSLAGCVESRSPFAPPVVADRPDAVYVPSHFEGMASVGTDTSGPLAASLTYSYPHRFWLVSGTDRNRVRIKPADSIHLMLQVWDEASETPLAGTSPRVDVTRDGTVLADRIFWPMLSQRMGFHYGDNLQLDGDGTYSIGVSVPPTNAQPTGGLSDRLGGHERFAFELDFQQSALEDLPINTVPSERAGTAGALEPMTGMPGPTGRNTAALPGRRIGRGTSDEMVVSASRVTGPDGSPTLLLSVRTPYNEFPIPMAGPFATVNGERRRLRAALDPAFGMHYRASFPPAGDSDGNRIRFPVQPQVPRHEGYETAFGSPGPVDL